MVEQHSSKDKKESSIFIRVINFIKDIFVSAVNWFRSLFKKKEETPKQATSDTPQNTAPAPVAELKPAISNAPQQPVIQQEPKLKPLPKTAPKEKKKTKVKETVDEANEALLAAIKKEKDLNLIEELLKKADPKSLEKNPSVLLYKAIKAGHVDVVKLLMKYGVDLKFDCIETSTYGLSRDTVSELKSSALELAIEYKHPDLIRLCLDTKLPVPEQHLGEVIKIGHVESIRRTLEDKRQPINNVQPLIEEAIDCNQLEILKLFLIYAQEDSNVDYDTIFVKAVQDNNIEVVKLLLEHKPIGFDKEMDICLDYVTENNYHEIAELLSQFESRIRARV